MLFFCCATRDNDIIFNMLKEVTVRKMKKSVVWLHVKRDDDDGDDDDDDDVGLKVLRKT